MAFGAINDGSNPSPRARVMKYGGPKGFHAMRSSGRIGNSGHRPPFSGELKSN